MLTSPYLIQLRWHSICSIVVLVSRRRSYESVRLVSEKTLSLSALIAGAESIVTAMRESRGNVRC